jgi:hypothetical protein
MGPATEVSLTTVRLSCIGPSHSAFGTGYFYAFQPPSSGAGFIGAIITNKHVVEGSDRLEAMLQIMPAGTEIKENGSAPGERSFECKVPSLQKFVVPHPDPSIDLCAILIGPIINSIPTGFYLKAVWVSKHWHVPTGEVEHLRPIESIVMVGYPNGLWDEVNNRPVIRRGLTASHALLNWNGARQFMIDAACFGGSSGSPVFLYEDGLVRTGQGYSPGTKALFLGTLWGGPTVDAAGRLEARAIPTATESIPVIRLMMNLGFVVHAAAASELEDPVAERVKYLDGLARTTNYAPMYYPSSAKYNLKTPGKT